MAPRVLDLPHDSCWTGSMAAWAPFPAQLPQPQLAGAGLPPLKSSSRGVWLRSDASGVLTVQWRPAGAPPLLVCTLRSSGELLSAPLMPGAFAFKLLCPQHTAAAAAGAPGPNTIGHLLLLTLAVSASSASAPSGCSQRTFTIAVRFDTAQAGRECGALLLAIHQGSLQVVQPAPPPAPMAAPAPAAAMRQHEEQQQGHGPVRGGSSGVEEEAADAAEAGGASRASAMFGFQDEASLVASLQVRLRLC